MKKRTLGRTGLEGSAIGLGCVQLASSRTEYAVQIVQRAVELGINYYDVARGYGDAEIKLGLGLQGRRQEVYVSTKTGAKTRDDAWRHLEESLERLGTGYVDNCLLHALRLGEDMDRRLGQGGALEALVEAKEQGLVRHIGCSSHRSEALVEALGRFDFEVILVPMNIVEREPLDELIPLCHQKGVGVTIMKPLATGLLPAQLALKWLVNQPIATAVPGCTTLEELEENAGAGRGGALTPQELERVQALKAEWEHKRCRVCGACEPCPQGIPIAVALGTDVMGDHYRTMGPQTFRAFPWSRERIERDLEQRQQGIALVESCTRCGECESKCPYGLPVMDMLESIVPAMRDVIGIYRGLLAPA